MIPNFVVISTVLAAILTTTSNLLCKLLLKIIFAAILRWFNIIFKCQNIKCDGSNLFIQYQQTWQSFLGGVGWRGTSHRMYSTPMSHKDRENMDHHKLLNFPAISWWANHFVAKARTSGILMFFFCIRFKNSSSLSWSNFHRKLQL